MEVTLEEVLRCREERAQEQKRLLGTYGRPLISFTVNMPGPVKLCPESRYVHAKGVPAVQQALERAGFPVLYSAARETPGGMEAFWAVDAPAQELKVLTCALEDGSPLGRLYDLDVLAPDTGAPLARESVGRPRRTCLLCGGEAAVCARSRTHSVKQLTERIRTLVADDQGAGDETEESMTEQKWTAEAIGSAAVRALLYELSATPKPGLVDRCNSGAHCDMDFFTFLNSTSVLAPYFIAVAAQGLKRKGQKPATLFAAIRPLGVQADRDMFAATGGINTHKGAVFTLGLLCAAAGSFAGRGLELVPAELCAFCGEMTEGLCVREYAGLAGKQALTKGERLFLEQGVGGVRAEAEAGFPCIRNIAYPVLEECLLEGRAPLERCLLHTLLYLMAGVDDTNVLGRKGKAAALYVKGQAALLLESGGALPGSNLRELERMDRDFIARGISPGGSADLLAAAFFLFALRHPGYRGADAPQNG